MARRYKTLLVALVPATLLATTIATTASAAPRLAVSNFGYDNNAGGWRVNRHPRMLAELDGDDQADIVGFGNAGVWVSMNTGGGYYSAPRLAVGNFGYDGNAGGWRVDRHPRFMADVNADGQDDVVGFGYAGVWISLNTGDGYFAAPYLAVNNFGYDGNAGGWRVSRHPRMLGDLTGDGAADIVGFGNAGVWVSLNDGDGGFAAPYLAVDNFGYDAGGWRVGQHPRMLAELDGDGQADIVGFGNAGVWVSLNLGDGVFESPRFVVDTFGYQAGGWQVDRHPRMMADCDGDGEDDIVGFGNAGVYVALNLGDGTFEEPQFVIATFGYQAGGWRVNRHPRMTGLVNGDDRADIVGFGNAGVYVARSTGNGNFGNPYLAVSNFGYSGNAGSWRVDRHPRMLGDIDGDGRDEIVGFGYAGVWVSEF
jgi:hypothetical protein